MAQKALPLREQQMPNSRETNNPSGNNKPLAQPGSPEKNTAQTDTTELPGDPLLFNVSEPLLIYYPAHPATRNGASVIVCPGGGFYYEHIKTEGTDVAKWLNAKGIAVFILQYHTVHCETTLPVKERGEKRQDTTGVIRLLSAVVPQAIADAKQSIAYVRKHAAEWDLSPNRIGIMGFSAGGTLAVACAFDFINENKPDFIAPIYPYVPPTLNMNIGNQTPPVFIAAASDDEYHLVPASIDLYSRWLKAGRPAELHIYSKGGHGFGMNRKDQPSDSWINRFEEWFRTEGL